MGDVSSSGEWREERLWVLKSLEDLKEELRRQSLAAEVERKGILEKATKDIFAAHEKIRALEDAKEMKSQEASELRLKNWALIGLLSVVGTGLLELLRVALHK